MELAVVVHRILFCVCVLVFRSALLVTTVIVCFSASNTFYVVVFVFFLNQTRVLAFIADVFGPRSGCFVLILALAVDSSSVVVVFGVNV